MRKATITERLDKHDREIAAIRKLLLIGMKMLNELAAAQRETDRQLRALIQSLRRGGNSHGKRQVL